MAKEFQAIQILGELFTKIDIFSFNLYLKIGQVDLSNQRPLKQFKKINKKDMMIFVSVNN